MAQRQTQQPRVSEAERAFTERLVNRGYTQDQARQIIDIVQRLRRGEHVNLNPVQSNWVGDINSINNNWSAVSGSTRRVSQLTPEQIREISSGLRGPERPAIALRQETRPAPVRTFVYEVQVDGRDYRVELNREMPSRGLVTLQSSRVGQLRAMLSQSPSPILAVTMPDGTTARPGTPAYAQFAQSYAGAFNGMQRDPEATERIVITSASPRRRREG